jgi:23S rRNA pseudouridine1911/1915/1917 synthase
MGRSHPVSGTGTQYRSGRPLMSQRPSRKAAAPAVELVASSATPPVSAPCSPPLAGQAELLDDDLQDLPDEGGLPPVNEADWPLCEAVIDGAQHAQRLDVVCAALAPQYSRNHIKQLIEDGLLTVNGQVATSASRKASAGQVLSLRLRPTAQSMAFQPEAMDLSIVFEDEHLLVVNKPVGMVVHPAAGNWTGTLMNGLLAHHPGAAGLPRAGIVHRLDKDTSGLMVVGKTLVAVTALSRAIAAREVSRQYQAIAHGQVPDALSIDAPIGRDPQTRVRMAVIASGKPARTDVQRLATGQFMPPGATTDRSLSGVWCTLHSGRTHQIRVHLTSRKHPLVADALYGGAHALGMQRQALHAARLAFTHPITQAELVFTASLPPDMAAAWAQLQPVADNP